MAIEIERKFLVIGEAWRTAPAVYFCQGYLSRSKERTVRVRVAGELGYLTIKGATTGASRVEFEYEIPREEAQELLDQFSVSELSKIRYLINFKGKLWEVDEFLGENEGLMVAEIELTNEEEEFSLPPWIAKEVTGEEKYYNSNLTQLPFKNWK